MKQFINRNHLKDRFFLFNHRVLPPQSWVYSSSASISKPATSPFMLVTSFSPWHKFLRSASSHKQLIYSHARPSSYQATQCFISTVESLQFLTYQLIHYSTINESLAKFLDLGAIMGWMLQKAFQRLDRDRKGKIMHLIEAKCIKDPKVSIFLNK